MGEGWVLLQGPHLPYLDTLEPCVHIDSSGVLSFCFASSFGLILCGSLSTGGVLMSPQWGDWWFGLLLDVARHFDLCCEGRCLRCVQHPGDWQATYLGISWRDQPVPLVVQSFIHNWCSSCAWEARFHLILFSGHPASFCVFPNSRLIVLLMES